jgi:hypothetical protein
MDPFGNITETQVFVHSSPPRHTPNTNAAGEHPLTFPRLTMHHSRTRDSAYAVCAPYVNAPVITGPLARNHNRAPSLKVGSCGAPLSPMIYPILSSTSSYKISIGIGIILNKGGKTFQSEPGGLGSGTWELVCSSAEPRTSSYGRYSVE